jgi:hypothetical protein
VVDDWQRTVGRRVPGHLDLFIGRGGGHTGGHPGDWKLRDGTGPAVRSAAGQAQGAVEDTDPQHMNLREDLGERDGQRASTGPDIE